MDMRIVTMAGALVWMSHGLKAIPGQHYGADTLPNVIAALASMGLKRMPKNG